ncbi:MAG TPA: GAF domain-containing protein, partial [Mycobacteriales bacterium]|nr:GAF domain-containing protein [Mycobacteriales bacterium]
MLAEGSPFSLGIQLSVAYMTGVSESLQYTVCSSPGHARVDLLLRSITCLPGAFCRFTKEKPTMSAPDLVPQSERWAAALDDVTCALKNLNEVLLDQEELQPLLQQICEQVTRAVPGVDEATVTLLSKGRPHTAASTSETVTELDRDQYRTGDGPCLRAARTGKTVRVVVDDARREWPQFAEASYAAGMGSFLSSPLRLNQQHAGAINCYSRQGHGFVRLDVRLLQLFTAAAEAILRTHQRYAQVRELAAQLRV